MSGQESLEAFRYRMLVRGYMNKSELQRFADCGKKNAYKLFDMILKDATAEGVERLQGNLILTRRVLSYVGLSEKAIIDDYNREKSR